MSSTNDRVSSVSSTTSATVRAWYVWSCSMATFLNGVVPIGGPAYDNAISATCERRSHALAPTNPNRRELRAAVSCGGRDKLVESFGGSIPSERFAGAAVEESRDVVEVVLAVGGQVG